MCSRLGSVSRRALHDVRQGCARGAGQVEAKGCRHFSLATPAAKEELAARQPQARGLLSTAVGGADLLKLPGMGQYAILGVPGVRGADHVEVPTELLERLLETDAAHSANMEVVSVSMEGVLDAVQPHRAAKFMHSELPKRFAIGRNMVEKLPGWRQVPPLVQMHDRLQCWFNRMRMVRRGRDVGLKDFTQQIKMVWHEGQETVPLVTAGMHKLRRKGLSWTEQEVDEWMDDFLRLRISTNMLMDQYIALTWQHAESGGKGTPTGIVKHDCNPTEICEAAARTATRLCARNTGKRPLYTIETYVVGRHGPQLDSHKITYIPSYLRYIMLEILKNSFAATVRSGEEGLGLQDRPVHILVSLDEESCVVRVSDRAGGIPQKELPRIWSYLYGATARSTKVMSATALSGYGIGLPLSRLHARYLGGDLRLESYPGFGTDVHLHLPTISTKQCEEFPRSTDLPRI